MRQPKDRGFVETEEGLIFCLVGYLHPPNGYTAYLKYTPAETGRWARGTKRFRRELEYYHVWNVAETLEFLSTHHPCYVGFDPVRTLSFSFVPRDAVTIYYRPEERLQGIMAAPADPLEKDVEALVSLLVAAGGPTLEAFGITGSILLQTHDPSFSDIDLVVYGRDATAKVRAAVTLLKGGPTQAIATDRLARWRAETAGRFGLAPEDVAHLEARRWNYFQFRIRYVSIHPIRREEEIQEAYGQPHYRAAGSPRSRQQWSMLPTASSCRPATRWPTSFSARDSDGRSPSWSRMKGSTARLQIPETESWLVVWSNRWMRAYAGLW